MEPESNSLVKYSNVVGCHPELVNLDTHPELNQENTGIFSKVIEKNALDLITPPIELNILSVSNTKLPSKLISLSITSQSPEGLMKMPYRGYAIRPVETFPFDESSFSNGEGPSSSNIEEVNVEPNKSNE